VVHLRVEIVFILNFLGYFLQYCLMLVKHQRLIHDTCIIVHETFVLDKTSFHIEVREHM
jgi:hypothetical protein